MDKFIVKMRQLNVHAGMAAEILRSTIIAKITTYMQYRLTAFATPDTDEEWLDLVVGLGKVEEAHKKETRVLNKVFLNQKIKEKGRKHKKPGTRQQKNATRKTCLPDE